LNLKILHRYVLKEMMGPFLIGLVVYSFLFLINLLFQLANLVIQQGLSAGASGMLFLLGLPGLLSYTLPVALLLGTIIAFSRLSGDSEIIALRAGGVSSTRLLASPLLFASAMTLLLLAMNLWLIPASRSASDEIQSEASQGLNIVRLLRPGVFFDRIPGVLLYAGRADVKAGRYEHILVFQSGSPSQDLLTLADYGRAIRSADGQSLQFLLSDGETVQFDRKRPGTVQTSTFREQALTVETQGGQLSPPQKGIMEYSTAELLGTLNLPPQESDPALIRRQRYALLYELHRRLSASLLPLFFVLIGVPLGMVNTRGGKGAGFSLSLIVLLGYWILTSALGDLAQAGRLPPSLAAWLPDLLLVLVGLLLVSTRDRITTPAWMRPFALLFPARQEKAAFDAAVPDSPKIEAGRGLPILDRYLLGRMLKTFLLISLSVLLLDWIIEIRGLSEFITGSQKLKLLGTYLLNQSPGVLVMLVPLAVLMTVLVTYGVLERTNEILAMKASGISVYRISLPAFALAAAACLVLWTMGQEVVPATSRSAQNERDHIKGVVARNLASTMDVWLFAPDRHVLFHYNHYDARTKTFQGFSEYRFSPDRFRLDSRFFAKEASFPASSAKAGVLTFTQGWRWRRGGTPPFQVLPQGSRQIGLPQPYFVPSAFLDAQYFSSSQLKALIRELQAKGYPSRQQVADYYEKLPDALAPLVLLLLGLPFAFATGRRGSLYGMAIALGLSISYYVMMAIFNSVGAMDWLNPALAVWAPAILFGCAGGYLLLNLRT
jgi:LPS export ABC transporter permease LptF/LPS export ABC transporter permease LptG